MTILQWLQFIQVALIVSLSIMGVCVIILISLCVIEVLNKRKEKHYGKEEKR